MATYWSKTNKNTNKNKNRLLIDNTITESDEEALLRSPVTDMEIEFIYIPIYKNRAPSQFKRRSKSSGTTRSKLYD